MNLINPYQIQFFPFYPYLPNIAHHVQCGLLELVQKDFLVAQLLFPLIQFVYYHMSLVRNTDMTIPHRCIKSLNDFPLSPR